MELYLGRGAFCLGMRDETMNVHFGYKDGVGVLGVFCIAYAVFIG